MKIFNDRVQGKIILLLDLCFFVFLLTMNCELRTPNSLAQEAKEPIVVNGDEVEYSTDNKEITAKGKVEIIYKGSKLTCQKLTVNTQTKEAVAEGLVVLDDQKGSIEGSKMIYNFDTKRGTVLMLISGQILILANQKKWRRSAMRNLSPRRGLSRRAISTVLTTA